MDHDLTSSVRLSNDEVAPLLDKNNLGKLKYIKSISKGIESHTYSLITENDSLILTLFTAKSPHLAFIQQSSQFFKSKGFPLSDVLAIGEIQQKPAMITSHLSGKGKSDWNEGDYEQIGFLLANFHKCSSTLPVLPTNLPFIWGLSTTFFEIQHQIPNEFLRLEEEIFAIEEMWPLDLPKGLIHGDLWHKKFLFSNDTITGILDFNPTYEPFTLDLANLIKGIPADKQSFQSALLSGYELARPLSSKELQSLDLFVYAKIIATTLYLLRQSIHHPSRKNEFQTYAFLNLLKLDSLLASL